MFKRILSLFVLLMMIIGSAYAQTTRTWTFNPWPTTSSATTSLDGSNFWNHNASIYYYKGEANANTPLYISLGTLLPEAEGLLFHANGNASNITTDLKYDITIKNGASVIIPNAKVGQIITLFSYTWGDGKLTMVNANINGSTTYNGTGSWGEVTIKVVANGDVKLSFSTVMNIGRISIADNPLNRFSSMGSQKYTYVPGATFSHTIIVEPKDALTSGNVSQLIEVTSTNPNAVSTSDATLSYNATNGRLTVSGLSASGIGDAELKFKYKGGAYTAMEYTTAKTFQVRNATTLSFS